MPRSILMMIYEFLLSDLAVQSTARSLYTFYFLLLGGVYKISS